MTGSGRSSRCSRTRRINDILINGHECVYVERARHARAAARAASRTRQHLLRIINKIVSAVGRRVDESHPMCDARLLDGSRVNVAVRPIGVDGPLVSIRKFSKKPFNLNKLVEVGALRPQMAEVLAAAVKARITTIISGGTGSGKTTMLNALSAFISEKERLITIEDAAELQLQQPHVGAHGDAAAQHRRQGRNPPARAGQERAAHAARPHHPRRVPRRGSLRHAAGHEHRPRRLDGHHPRQHAARRDLAPRADDRHGRPADDGRVDPRPDRRRHPADRAAAAPVRRQAQGDQRSPRSPAWKATSSRCRRSSNSCAPAPRRTARSQGHFQATGVRPRFLAELVAMGIKIPGSYFDPSQAAVDACPMPFDIDPIYLIYLLVGGLGRGCSSRASICCSSHARPIARTSTAGCKLLDNQPDRESVLVQLRRERGLTSGGDYRLPLVALNRLMLQSGLTLGIGKLADLSSACSALFAFGRHDDPRDDIAAGAAGARCSAARCCRCWCCKFMRGRRQKKFGAQFPDALDIIVRSLRAGHPVPIAINMVAREMPDPIGSEFGIVADEITYGADLETGDAQSVFPRRPGRPAAVRHRGRDPGLDRRQSRRNPGKPVRRHPPALQDAPQDPRAGRRRPRLGADPVVAADRACSWSSRSSTPDFYASVWHEDLTKIVPRRRRRLDGRSAISSCSAWSTSGSDRWSAARHSAERFGDSHHGAGAAGVPRRRRRWRSASWRWCACAARSSAAPPASAESATATGATAARSLRYSSLQGRAARASNTPPSIIRRRNDEDMKVLRRRLIQAGIYDPRAVAYFFLGRAALAVGARGAAVRVRCRWCSRRRLGVLADRDRRRHPRLSRRRASISTSASRRARPSTASGFPDFMDLLVVCADAGLQHGGGARARRPRARRFLSVAHRQHPHGQSRNPRRPHHDARRSSISATGSASRRRARSPP